MRIAIQEFQVVSDRLKGLEHCNIYLFKPGWMARLAWIGIDMAQYSAFAGLDGNVAT